MNLIPRERALARLLRSAQYCGNFDGWIGSPCDRGLIEPARPGKHWRQPSLRRSARSREGQDEPRKGLRATAANLTLHRVRARLPSV